MGSVMAAEPDRVRPPVWALAAGLPAPEDGEGYTAYWLRVGVDQGTITWSLMGLSGARLDVANERMATELGRRCPQAYARHVASLVRAHGTR
jgi:hypothetical protein